MGDHTVVLAIFLIFTGAAILATFALFARQDSTGRLHWSRPPHRSLQPGLGRQRGYGQGDFTYRNYLFVVPAGPEHGAAKIAGFVQENRSDYDIDLPVFCCRRRRYCVCAGIQHGGLAHRRRRTHVFQHDYRLEIAADLRSCTIA